jgi:hypothetical protein
MPGATSDGPLVGDGGQTFLLGPDGPSVVGVGNPIASAGDTVAIDSCTNTGRCGPVLVNVRTGERREVAVLQSEGPRSQAMGYVLSDDGQLVEVTQTEAPTHLRWIDASGHLVAEGDLADSASESAGRRFNGLPGFLPSGQGLVWGSTDGVAVHISTRDGNLLVEPIPGRPIIPLDRVMVIRP